ncbi:linear amide C-N hydrolase [uncultured Methanobrevibacter sp.]|uniref:linear amide C-N hydrolase n=1 Tax=uncultured Methanobrevibacter sp. TaxID=253161 RepID=UPI0025DAB06D|nr:linear amide C-N hydrolase [uncultured Methanobrevibacter sp.]
MCSTLKYNYCIGRNFDYEVSYNEELRVIEKHTYDNEYKIIGMCTGIIKDYPLLYDGMNERGLCVCGLAFMGNAVYNPVCDDKLNIPSYKFPLEILSKYENLEEVKNLLDNVNITNEQYSENFPPSDLHWFIADKDESIIVEQTKDGLNYYEGELMTNNPPYPQQLENYHIMESKIGNINFKLDSEYNTRGLETYYLSGDYTSMGRFERLAYIKEKLEETDNSFNDANQVLHLLSSIEQIYGLTDVNGSFEYTIYSIVYDMDNLEVYLKFYNDFDLIREKF